MFFFRPPGGGGGAGAMRRVAVIGAGIAGLVCARRLSLSGRARVVLFEKEPRAGGHALTFAARDSLGEYPLDVAFTVYNRRNYPEFCALLEDLGVEGRATSMSFSVSHAEGGWEYNGGSAAGLFADPASASAPEFWRMLAGILKMNLAAKSDLRREKVGETETLGAYLSRRKIPPVARERYLLPMGAAIWSCNAADFAEYPARFALEFFSNHGLLDLAGRPQWMFIPGGCRRYVERILDDLRARDPHSARLGAPALSARRLSASEGGGFRVETPNGAEHFDAAVFALHSRDALRIFENADDAERAALGGVRWADNTAALHSDVSVLPRRRRAWACWNYRVPKDGGRAMMTYNLTMLQKFHTREPMLLTLNGGGFGGGRRAQFSFAHPVMDAAALRANRALDEMSGTRGAHFCGAWRGRGFHEDGVVSGLRAAGEALRCSP